VPKEVKPDKHLRDLQCQKINMVYNPEGSPSLFQLASSIEKQPMMEDRGKITTAKRKLDIQTNALIGKK